MSCTEAMHIMKGGGCVYRRKWPSDKFLMVRKNRIVLVICRMVQGVYIFTAEDLAARDWMQELFAEPVSRSS